MIQLELKDDEGEALREILRSYLSDLRMEIADTDSKDFRESLKEKEAFLNRLLGLLRPETVSRIGG